MTDGIGFQEKAVWVGGEVKVKEKQSHWEGGSRHCYFPGQIPGRENNPFFLSCLETAFAPHNGLDLIMHLNLASNL